MPELGFQAAPSSSGRVMLPHSAIRSVDSSPNSVIRLLRRSPSLFSSPASTSLNNSPPMSVSGNPESHTSSNSNEAIQKSCGPDSDPKELSALGSWKVDDPKVVEGEDSQVEVEEDNNSAIGSCTNSISSAYTGRWQEKKVRSDRFRQRQISLDFSNAMANSPRNGAVKKSGLYSQHSGAFLSPGAPNYRHSSVGLQKGWSSERVPLPCNSNRRQGSCTMLPYSYGKTLPSKWEDAERWIFSPVSADGFIKPGVPRLHKQHKSISGPIGAGPPGIAYYSLHSPQFSMPEGGANHMAGTAFSAGVIATDGVEIQYSGHDGNQYARRETYMARSVSLHGHAADMPDTLDELASGFKDASTNILHNASRRNMATQMSPEDSIHSSPRKRPSISTLSVVESQSYQSKSDIKDVEVDEKVTLTRWSKKHKMPKSSRSSTHTVDDWAKKAIVSQSSAWDVSETGKGIARFNREEARITAWENLQKAKAEAAMRRLEMTLEKKRSSSMDKIMNKLRSAQRRAQAMRSSVLANQNQHAVTTKTSLSCKSHQVRSLSGCFTCHAF